MPPKEFARLVDRVMRPWLPKASDEMIEDYYAALFDLGAHWIREGGRQVSRTRLRSEGLPTPGDWRLAAERLMIDVQRRTTTDHPEPLDKEKAKAFLDRLRKR